MLCTIIVIVAVSKIFLTIVINQVGIFIGRKIISILGYSLDVGKCIKRYGQFVLGWVFGSNQDYTVCTARTVDSCCRCVFQYFDRLNIGRIQRLKGTTDETVDNNQRTGFCCDRVDTTYTDGIVFSRITGTREN